jgi:hypothetical protein
MSSLSSNYKKVELDCRVVGPKFSPHVTGRAIIIKVCEGRVSEAPFSMRVVIDYGIFVVWL